MPRGQVIDKSNSELCWMLPQEVVRKHSFPGQALVQMSKGKIKRSRSRANTIAGTLEPL